MTSVIHPSKGHVIWRKIIITGVVSAIAAISFAGTASAAELPKPGTPGCFGQVHKAVNGGVLEGAGINNVGDLVDSKIVNDLGKKGQGKKALATALCTPPK